MMFDRPVPVDMGVEPAAAADAIARAAARLFAQKGYEATSVREIAEAAGVTKPTLYYYFGSKEGLADALVTGPMVSILDRVRQRLKHESDPVKLIVDITEDKFADCRAEPDRWRFVLGLAFGPHVTSVASRLAEHADKMDAVLRESVDRLAAAGVIEADAAPAFTSCLRGLTIVHALDFLYRGCELGPDLAERLVSDLLRGFGRDRRAGS